MSNAATAVHEATISALNSQINESNGQLHAHLVSGDAAGATKARRKIANLTVELETAQKLAGDARVKAQEAAAAAIDADTHQIGTAAVAEVNATLAQHGVSERLRAGDTRFMGQARNIAIANHELNVSSDAFRALQEKADRIEQALDQAVKRHSALKANRTHGDAAGASDLYGLSLDIESLSALHAEAVAKVDAVDVATPRSAIAYARAVLVDAKNRIVREALFAHAQATEAAFMSSIHSLVGFVRVNGEPFEKNAKPLTIYPIGDALDWLIRTGALRG